MKGGDHRAILKILSGRLIAGLVLVVSATGCASEDQARVLPRADGPPHSCSVYLGSEDSFWSLVGTAAQIAHMFFGT